MPEKNPPIDYRTMSVDVAVKHFQDRGVPMGLPIVVTTQEQLIDVLQGYRGAIATRSGGNEQLAHDMKTYLMHHGVEWINITPTKYE